MDTEKSTEEIPVFADFRMQLRIPGSDLLNIYGVRYITGCPSKAMAKKFLNENEVPVGGIVNGTEHWHYADVMKAVGS